MKLTRAQKDLIKCIAFCVNTFHTINVNGHSTQDFFTDLHTFKHNCAKPKPNIKAEVITTKTIFYHDK